MSRIGKKPIDIPKGVEVNIAGTAISVKGPKGSLHRDMPSGVTINREANHLQCSIPEGTTDKALRARFGLVRSLLANMVTGVATGFSRELEIVGVGYKAKNDNPNQVTINIGYSHPVVYQSPKDITLKVEGQKILVSGADKEMVGQVAAEIRKIRKPMNYKLGAGIRYTGERVRIKVGKKLAA
jgi:large subunit ribosomal protein L6